jgi:hypothetical protein
MARYYFHYRGPDGDIVEDRIGSPHPDVEAVEREAHMVARDILQGELSAGGSPSATRCLEIEDESGALVLYLPFWASIVVEPSAEALRTGSA